jgi:hypothetical protein
MLTFVESSDADLARAVATRGHGSAEAAESKLYRRFAPRVRLYGLRHLRDDDAARDLVQQRVLWVTPAAVVHQMPSMRLQLTLASAGDTRAELGGACITRMPLRQPF